MQDRAHVALKHSIMTALSGFSERKAVDVARAALTESVDRWLGLESYEVADFEEELAALIDKWSDEIYTRRMM